ALAAPIAYAHSVVDGMVVLVTEHGEVTLLSEGATSPAPFVHLPAAPMQAASTRMSLTTRATGLAGVAVARISDDEVHVFTRPRPVEHEHATIYPLGAPPRRPIDLEPSPTLVTAWLATAIGENERAVVRIEAPRPRGDSLDGAHAVVHTLRFEGAG